MNLPSRHASASRDRAARHRFRPAIADVLESRRLMSVASFAVSVQGVSLLTGYAVANYGVTVTVTPKDSNGQTITNFTGAVSFASNDPGASLPPSQNFAPTANGSEPFPVTFETLGLESLTVTAANGASGTATTRVSPVVSGFSESVQGVSLLPGYAVANYQATVTISALDASGNVIPYYGGNVKFTSTDPAATLPSLYTFNPSSDGGMKSFPVTFGTLGLDLLTVTASNNASKTISIRVSPVATSFTESVTGIAGGVAVVGEPAMVTISALDASGNLIPYYGGNVNFTSTDPAATLPPYDPYYTFDPVTDGGMKSFPVTFNTAGSEGLTVTATDGATQTVQTQVIPVDLPSIISATAGASQSASVGSAFASTFQAMVEDQYGNPLSGAVVTFAAPTSGPGGGFSGSKTVRATTNAQGEAITPAFAANTVAGSYVVTATVSGVPTLATFSLTNTAASAASIVATAGASQAATVGSAFAAPLRATVKDRYGNPIAGDVVTFAAPATGAGAGFVSGESATATTNALGVATAPTLIANTTAGGYAVVASVPGVASSASFNLINVASTSTSLAIQPGRLVVGQPVILTATVAALAPARSEPTGLVRFFDGSNLLGSATVGASGIAELTTQGLGFGPHSITAAYAGDASDSPSGSASVQIRVADTSTGDFDGDGKADIAVYGKDPRDNKYDFRILTSSTGFNPADEVVFDNNGYGFGNAQSIPVPGNYFGDGRDAYALWTPNGSGGMSFTAISSVTGKSVTINFGYATDLPVIGDFAGDGKAELAVFGKDPADGNKYDFRVLDFSLSATGKVTTSVTTFDNNGYGFGNARSIPVVGDFDGQGHADFGLFNPSDSGSTFTYIDPVNQSSLTRTVGAATDTPTVADVDGDGESDLVLYGPDPSKPGHYRYLTLTSSSGFNPAKAVTFDNFGYGYGNANSLPVVADYEGTGKADYALFTPDNKGGMEFIYQTGQVGQGVTLDFATTGDLPLNAPAFVIARKVRGD